MKRNEVIGAAIVVFAVLVVSVISGIFIGEKKDYPSTTPKKPFIVSVSREVMDE